jgi:hypothetical protein
MFDTALGPPQIALYDGESASNTAGVGVANNVYFVPVLCNRSSLLTALRVSFGAGGAGHYDVGIYDSTGLNEDPGNLLAHAASTNVSLVTATGVQTPAFLTGNLGIGKGLYWLALWIDNATDTINKSATISTGRCPIRMMTGVAGPLPSVASGLVNASLKPIIVGILSTGWQ